MFGEKESQQVITCICNKCKSEKRVSLLLGVITSFFCDKCQKDVSDFETRPVMIPASSREYNPFREDMERW